LIDQFDYIKDYTASMFQYDHIVCCIGIAHIFSFVQQNSLFVLCNIQVSVHMLYIFLSVFALLFYFSQPRKS